MRILYLCQDHGIPVMGRKGCSTHVRETCQAIRAAGHEPTLLCSSKGEDLEASASFPIFEHPPPQSKAMGYDLRNMWHNIGFYRAAARLARETRAQAIYERFSLYGMAGTWLAARTKLPRVLEINAFLTVEQEHKLHFLALARAAERHVARRAPAIVVVSPPLLEQLVEIGVPRERIFIMPMAVDIEHFHPRAEGGDAVRRQWGLEGRYVVGYVGSLSGWHGINMLRDMAERILTHRNDFTIFVVGGEADHVERHRARAAERGLSDHLTFTGSVPYDRVPAHLAAMDVALVPDTNYWTCPTKMFEYQASGLPTVAPKYPAVVRAMDHGAEGLLFDPRDIQGAVDSILALADDPEKRARMGEMARQRVCATRSWQKNVEGTLRLFEGVRAGRLPSPDSF